jgi:hypothetical protein
MKWLVLLILVSFSALGASESFCLERKDPHFVRRLAFNYKNLLSFANRGGIARGGVCWWHSRFQRNALYLTHFSPEKPKPSTIEARDMIARIREGNSVVEIPGFENLYEFSLHFGNEIQKELERWQRHDVLRFSWMNGLRGGTSASPEELKRQMDELYEEVESKGNISYQRLQIRGIAAHSWLVVKMEKLSLGYKLHVVDSVEPSKVAKYTYLEGDTQLENEHYNKFMPYLEETAEVEELKSTIMRACPNV